MHARRLLRGAVARDGEAAAASGVAGRNRHVACGQGTRQREQRGLALGGVARYGNAAAPRDHEERSAALDAMIGGQELLAPDHGRRAQKIMADQLDDVAADRTGALPAHHRMRVAGTKKKGSRSRQKCERWNWNLLRDSREAMRLPHDDPSCPCFSVFCVALLRPRSAHNPCSSRHYQERTWFLSIFTVCVIQPR